MLRRERHRTRDLRIDAGDSAQVLIEITERLRALVRRGARDTRGRIGRE